MAKRVIAMSGKWEITVVHADAFPTHGFRVSGSEIGRMFYHASGPGRQVVVDAPNWSLALLQDRLLPPRDRDLLAMNKKGTMFYRGRPMTENMRYDPERGLTLSLSLKVPQSESLVYYPRITLDCVCLDEKINPPPSPEEKFDFTLKQ